MKNYILLSKCILIWIFANCGVKTNSQKNSNVQSLSTHEERLEFISENDTLVGYLSKPQNENTFPVIIVFHSASHGHHDNDLYNHLEKNMNDIGVGVFTYDRRGSGESKGDFNTASLETLAKDGLNAIEALKKRKNIQKDKIGLFGISQGGWLAPLAYSIASRDISFMILLSSSGVSPARQMEYSAVTTLKMNNYPDSIISTAKHLRKITNEYYRGNKERVSTQEEIDVYRNKPWFSDVYLPWRGNLPDDVSTTKWIHEMDFNPKKYFENVDKPIVLFYGQTDRWVPIDESIDIWNEVFYKNGNSKFEIYRVETAGHMMILNEENNPEQEIISDQYTRQLKKWVLENVK